MSTPFQNNLRAGDRVMDVKAKRPAKVQRTPKDDGSRMTCIIYEGTATGRYVDVMDLRLILNGRIEEVAPVDGEPPPLVNRIPVLTPAPKPAGGPVQTLEAQLAKNKEEMGRLEKLFLGLRAENTKIEQAIAVLKAP